LVCSIRRSHLLRALRWRWIRGNVIEKGHGALGWSGKLTEDDIVQAIREAEELLLLIDKYFGIPAENAEAGASSDYRADKTVVKD